MEMSVKCEVMKCSLSNDCSLMSEKQKKTKQTKKTKTVWVTLVNNAGSLLGEQHSSSRASVRWGYEDSDDDHDDNDHDEDDENDEPMMMIPWEWWGCEDDVDEDDYEEDEDDEDVRTIDSVKKLWSLIEMWVCMWENRFIPHSEHTAEHQSLQLIYLKLLFSLFVYKAVSFTSCYFYTCWFRSTGNSFLFPHSRKSACFRCQTILIYI